MDDRYHYGDVIIATDSVLRRPPSFVEAKQLIALEAIVFSTDTIERAFTSACDVALKLSGRKSPFSIEGTELSTFVWTIVDHLHVLRQLLPMLSDESVDFEKVAFFQLSAVARNMRNKMDHLAQNVPNLAAQRRNWPLFGAIQFFVPTAFHHFEDGSVTVAKGTYTVVTAGLHEADLQSGLKHAPNYPISTKIDLLELNAFGLSIEFAPVLAALTNILKQIDVHLNENVITFVEQRARTDEQKNEMGKSKHGELILHFGFEFPRTE